MKEPELRKFLGFPFGLAKIIYEQIELINVPQQVSLPVYPSITIKSDPPSILIVEKNYN